MALLVLFHNDLLIDLEQTSPKQIAKEIGAGIKSGLLLSPFALVVRKNSGTTFADADVVAFGASCKMTDLISAMVHS